MYNTYVYIYAIIVCSFLVGEGAHSWAQTQGIPVTSKSDLTTGQLVTFHVPGYVLMCVKPTL